VEEAVGTDIENSAGTLEEDPVEVDGQSLAAGAAPKEEAAYRSQSVEEACWEAVADPIGCQTLLQLPNHPQVQQVLVEAVPKRTVPELEVCFPIVTVWVVHRLVAWVEVVELQGVWQPMYHEDSS
jgi:hypothetical protein